MRSTRKLRVGCVDAVTTIPTVQHGRESRLDVYQAQEARAGALGLVSRQPMRVNGNLTFLALCCAALVSGQSSAAFQVLLQGRFGGDNQQLQYGSLPVIFSWPASRAFVSFKGTAVNVTLAALPATVANSQNNRFRFEIDGEIAATESTDLDNSIIEWGASGLTSGSHNLTITKLNEAAFGQSTLQDITLSTGGKYVFLIAMLTVWLLAHVHRFR